jgi:hypothetical protein
MEGLAEARALRHAGVVSGHPPWVWTGMGKIHEWALLLFAAGECATCGAAQM